MPWIRRVTLWLRALIFRGTVEREMEKEMRLHLDLEIENNIRLGHSPAEAKRLALLSFGGVERAKEDVRDERQTRWIEQTIADVRYALRGFRRQPLFAGGVVTLIALGVGANTAIFSVVNHLLIAPLPFPDGNRMAQFTILAGGGQIWVGATHEDVDRWRARAKTVEEIVTYQSADVEVGDSTLSPTHRVPARAITPGVLAFAHAHPMRGRDIEPSDTLSDAQPVTLISYEFWQREFGGRDDILGQRVHLMGKPTSIVGVMPKGFTMPFEDGPRDVYPAIRSTGGNGPIDAMAKVRPGYSSDDANRELRAIFSDRPEAEGVPSVMRAVDSVTRDTRRVLYLMFGAVVVVLLIVCANVANLMVARAWSRQREFAVRAAMGAGRGRLVRQTLTESMLLATAGGAAGCAVGYGVLRALRTVDGAERFDFAGAQIETHTLAWALVVCVLTGLLFGVAPALFVAGQRASEALKAGSRSATAGVGARRLRAALVIGEVALSATLLVAAGVLTRTIVAMQRADYGFDPRGLHGIRISLAGKHFEDLAARRAAMDAILEQVRAVPGVRAATLGVSAPPDFGVSMGALEIDGKALSPNDSLASRGFNAAPPDFFDVNGIRLVEGRTFTRNTALTDRFVANEIVVNESFARRFWPNGGAIGARLREGTRPWATIVGVARDVRLPSARRAWSNTQFYEPMPTAPMQASLIVRAALPIARIQPQIEAAVHRVSPFVKIGKVQTSEDLIVHSRDMHRFVLTLIGSFACVAALLAAFGLHAVISYGVGQRTREIGVRVALGAQAADVMRLVIGGGVRLAILGIVVGTIGGALMAGSMRALLYGVAPVDPLTLVLVSALMAFVGMGASLLPARRALRVDPIEALRAE